MKKFKIAFTFINKSANMFQFKNNFGRKNNYRHVPKLDDSLNGVKDILDTGNLITND